MILRRFALLSLALVLAGCAQDAKVEAKYPQRWSGDKDIVYQGERKGIFGDGGMNLFGGKKKAESGSGVAVNAFLWRAALDTISFMPISNADPFGGTILTDWYEDPSALGERVKANILILSRDLRTDALKVTLFRQTGVKGQWRDAPVDPKTVSALETAILTRARELKVAAAQK